MLKINLLPAYVRQKAALKKAIFLCLAVIILVGAGMLYWIITLKNEKDQREKETIAMEEEAKRVEEIRKQLNEELAKIPPVEKKVNFIQGTMDYNLKAPEFYEELARYTYNRVELSSMNISGNRVTMNAHARTLGDFGRYLLNMYNATSIYTNVSVSTIPGWPSATLGTSGPGPLTPGGRDFTGVLPGITNGIDFTVNCTLVKPLPGPPTY